MNALTAEEHANQDRKRGSARQRSLETLQADLVPTARNSQTAVQQEKNQYRESRRK